MVCAVRGAALKNGLNPAWFAGDEFSPPANVPLTLSFGASFASSLRSANAHDRPYVQSAPPFLTARRAFRIDGQEIRPCVLVLLSTFTVHGKSSSRSTMCGDSEQVSGAKYSFITRFPCGIAAVRCSAGEYGDGGYYCKEGRFLLYRYINYT